MWCSEQAVGEDVIPLLIAAGLSWTISDETVLARSVSGVGSAVAPPSAATVLPVAPSALGPASPYVPYRLERESRKHRDCVPRPHSFRSHRLHLSVSGIPATRRPICSAGCEICARLSSPQRPRPARPHSEVPLVTIALDGENAWEYYPRDGRDFLRYLYEGLSSDPALRCVTVSEHLREHPPQRSLEWLHTGSWIGGDLRTWCGDKAHNAAWGQLGRARDAASRHGRASLAHGSTSAHSHAAESHAAADPSPPDSANSGASEALSAAWHHILVAEGSDWFWWFGEHHRTNLDYVWDRDFRSHLQEVYRLLGEPVPIELLLPLLEREILPARPPLGPVDPVIDGRLTDPQEWAAAGFLAPELSSTMQRATTTTFQEVRYGWSSGSLCLLAKPGTASLTVGLELELHLTWDGGRDDLSVLMTLWPEGQVAVSCTQDPTLQEGARAHWEDVIEASLPLALSTAKAIGPANLVLRIGRDGLPEHVFHAAGVAASGSGRAMSELDIITFTSDFGWAGGYVAACEAVVTTIAPEVRVLHVWHEVPAGDVPAGALTLSRVAPLFPPAVHLAVVDPGVGTSQEASGSHHRPPRCSCGSRQRSAPRRRSGAGRPRVRMAARTGSAPAPSHTAGRGGLLHVSRPGCIRPSRRPPGRRHPPVLARICYRPRGIDYAGSPLCRGRRRGSCSRGHRDRPFRQRGACPALLPAISAGG